MVAELQRSSTYFLNFRATCYVGLLKIQLLLGVDQQHMYSIWFNINMPWCIIYINIHTRIYIYIISPVPYTKVQKQQIAVIHTGCHRCGVRTLLQRISLPSKAGFLSKKHVCILPPNGSPNLPILWDPLTTVVRLEAGSKFCRCSSAQTSGLFEDFWGDSRGVWDLYTWGGS